MNLDETFTIEYYSGSVEIDVPIWHILYDSVFPLPTNSWRLRHLLARDLLRGFGIAYNPKRVPYYNNERFDGEGHTHYTSNATVVMHTDCTAIIVDGWGRAQSPTQMIARLYDHYNVDARIIAKLINPSVPSTALCCGTKHQKRRVKGAYWRSVQRGGITRELGAAVSAKEQGVTIRSKRVDTISYLCSWDYEYGRCTERSWKNNKKARKQWGKYL
jgi:hypothetical protein